MTFLNNKKIICWLITLFTTRTNQINSNIDSSGFHAFFMGPEFAHFAHYPRLSRNLCIVTLLTTNAENLVLLSEFRDFRISDFLLLHAWLFSGSLLLLLFFCAAISFRTGVSVRMAHLRFGRPRLVVFLGGALGSGATNSGSKELSDWEAAGSSNITRDNSDPGGSALISSSS